MLDAIKELSQAGFALHWLHNRAKRPIGDDWSSKPVTTFEQLKKSYRDGNNVGVRLGLPSKVGNLYLHVIDLDIRKPEARDEAYGQLEQLFPDVDSWPCVQSGSGGESRHFYFLSDQPFSSKKLAHSKESYAEFDESKDRDVKHWYWEIELFGTGKQVVMPPSIHPDTGLPYRWLRPFDFDLVTMGVGPVMASAAMPTAVRMDRTQVDDTDDLLTLVRTPPLGLTLDEIRDLVFALPYDEWCEDREGWRDVGMAIHHETAGSDEGFDIWCDFSSRSTKFDMKDARYQWTRFDSDRPDAKTMGSIKKVLRDDGADFLQCKAKLAMATKYRQAILDAAQYALSATEIDTILPRLVELAEAEGRTAHKASIKKDLNEARKAASEKADARRQKSLEDWLADEVLRLFWKSGDHLRRLGKLYWVYDKGVWRVLDPEVIDNRVYRLVVKVLKADGGEDGNPLQELLDKSGRADVLNALVGSVSGLIAKRSAHDSREDPLGLCRRHVDSVMNCLNGEIWFSEGKGRFIEHNPDHMLTVQLSTEFDRDATCPQWDAALRVIFRENEDAEDMIRHLHEVMGYVLQPTRELAAWVMFYGTGSNGKSLIASVLQTLLGVKSWVGKPLAGMDRNSNAHLEAGLVGKLMLLDDDYDKNSMLPDGALKKLSEAKGMTANPKHGAEFNFVARTTPFLLVNHWPKTRDMSFGLERRALVFHFNTTIAEGEKDVSLERRIAESELSGVLNHAIAGWKRLQERGAFLEPTSCKVAKRTWLGKRNTLAAFVSDCLEVNGELGAEVPALDVWSAFQLWSANDNSGLKWGRTTFYDEIASIPGVIRFTRHNTQWFRGVVVATVPSLFDDLDDVEVDDLI